MDVVENDFIKYWFEGDVLVSTFKEPTVVTLENAMEMIRLRHEISKGEKQYWCTDFENLKSFTKEGRDYADIHGQEFLFATAVIVNSQITKYLLNAFVKLKRPVVPLKAFKNRDEGIDWLKSMKLKKEMAT